MRESIPTESHEQRVLINHLEELKQENKILDFFAIPNGGTRNPAEAKKMKLEGVRKGVSDICVILNNKVLFIELKRRNKNLSRKSKEQISFLETIRKSKVCDGEFCYGYEEALEYLWKFL